MGNNWKWSRVETAIRAGCRQLCNPVANRWQRLYHTVVKGKKIPPAAESVAKCVSIWGSVTWKCLRAAASDSPKLRGGSQHFPVQSSTRPSMVSTGWVPACFHSEAIEQYPLVPGEKKENQCDSCEQIDDGAVNHVRCKMLFFFFLSPPPPSP